jgi:hypothetical protein
VAYDEQLADRIREALAGETVTEKKMFGGLAFMVGGHMSVSASRHGGLLVHVDPAQTEDMLGEPGTDPLERGHRPMRGWVLVSPDVLDDDDTLSRWVGRGLTCARSLPPK